MGIHKYWVEPGLKIHLHVSDDGIYKKYRIYRFQFLNNTDREVLPHVLGISCLVLLMQGVSTSSNYIMMFRRFLVSGSSSHAPVNSAVGPGWRSLHHPSRLSPRTHAGSTWRCFFWSCSSGFWESIFVHGSYLYNSLWPNKCFNLLPVTVKELKGFKETCQCLGSVQLWSLLLPPERR